MTRDALRQRIMDALDSSEARCPKFYAGPGQYFTEPCDGLDGCEFCLRLAADAVLRVASERVVCGQCGGYAMPPRAALAPEMEGRQP